MNVVLNDVSVICCHGRLTTQRRQQPKGKKIPPPKFVGVAVLKKYYFLGGIPLPVEAAGAGAAAAGAAAAGFGAAAGAGAAAAGAAAAGFGAAAGAGAEV